jgi:hypothetical protein
VRKVVKQLSFDILQQCLGATSCMRTRIVMEEHFTGCQHSTPLVHVCYTYDVIEKLWYRSKKYQSQSQFLRFVRTREHFRNPSCVKFTIAKSNCVNLIESVEIHMKVLKLSSTVCRNFVVVTNFKCPTTLLFIMNSCSPIFEHSTPLSCSSYIHYILAINHS